MSVYIPNMEMSTNCVDCRFHKDIYCTLTDICTNTAQRCPLVPVPPHGRLIDADALMENAQYKGTHDILTAWDVVAAPTIIPADHIGDVNEMVADKEGER